MSLRDTQEEDCCFTPEKVLPLVSTRVNTEIFRINTLAETEGNLGRVQAL